jgi:hypothetical protein
MLRKLCGGILKRFDSQNASNAENFFFCEGKKISKENDAFLRSFRKIKKEKSRMQSV